MSEGREAADAREADPPVTYSSIQVDPDRPGCLRVQVSGPPGAVADQLRRRADLLAPSPGAETRDGVCPACAGAMPAYTMSAPLQASHVEHLTAARFAAADPPTPGEAREGALPGMWEAADLSGGWADSEPDREARLQSLRKTLGAQGVLDILTTPAPSPGGDETLRAIEEALTDHEDFILVSKIGSPHMQTVSNERAAAITVYDALRRRAALTAPAPAPGDEGLPGPDVPYAEAERIMADRGLTDLLASPAPAATEAEEGARPGDAAAPGDGPTDGGREPRGLHGCPDPACWYAPHTGDHAYAAPPRKTGPLP